MKYPHDMGGEPGLGAIDWEVDEPIFHGEWEKRALALTVGMGFAGKWNLDISRHSRERLPFDFYRSSSYYQIWLAALQSLMIERGLVTAEEIKTGKMSVPALPIKHLVTGGEMSAALAAGGPVSRDVDFSANYKIGDEVRTLAVKPGDHTRLPGYLVGKSGKIASIHGCHVFPDSNSREEGENPQWLYSVAFDARHVFGDAAEANSIMVDCWEPYLECV